MRNFKHLAAILSLVVLFSCSKDYSNEAGGGLGKTCRLSNITAVNDQSGDGEYAFNTRFNSAGRSEYVELYDSVLNNADYTASLNYKTSDTITTSTGDVLVLDGSKRLKRLLTPLDPSNPGGEELIYDYTYNGSGNLIKKTLTSSVIPLPLLQTIYTWTSGNLTKVEASTSLTGTKMKILDVDLQYDLTKSPKNFMPIYPDGFESFLYITSVDMGKPSINLLSRVSAVYYDDQGKPLPAVVTEISQAKFTNDGYLTEWFVDGNSFDALGLFVGRNSFTYKCN